MWFGWSVINLCLFFLLLQSKPKKFTSFLSIEWDYKSFVHFPLFGTFFFAKCLWKWIFFCKSCAFCSKCYILCTKYKHYCRQYGGVLPQTLPPRTQNTLKRNTTLCCLLCNKGEEHQVKGQIQPSWSLKSGFLSFFQRPVPHLHVTIIQLLLRISGFFLFWLNLLS